MKLILLSVGATFFFLLLAFLILNIRQAEYISLEERLLSRGEKYKLPKKDSAIEKLQKDLLHSQSGITLPIYFIILAVSCVVIYVVIFFLIESVPAAFMAAFIGVFVPREVVRYAASARKSQFSLMFCKALKRMAASLRTSSTLPQAVEEIITSESMPPLIKEEFSKILSEYSYGTSMQQAFLNLYERTGVKDVHGVALAIEVANKKGTKLYETFDTYAEAVMVRKEGEATAKAELSSAKISAVVGAAVPFLFSAYFKISSPEYFTPLYEWHGGIGRYLLMAIYMFVAIGLYISLRMLDVKL